jgi:hypothetical protein
MSMKVSLNGIHVDALGTVGWAHTVGAYPHVQAFEMDKGEAAGLLNGGDVTLVIEDLKTTRIEKLSVIGEGPASAPMFRTVLVSDLRWKWNRKLITGRYNIRRRTGQKTLITENLVQLALSSDDFEFAPASLKNETTKWKPSEMLEDVFQKMSSGSGFDFSWTIAGNTDALEVNDVILNDKGPDALQIALSHLPGTMLWVDAQGLVHVESAIGLAEASVIEAMGPDIVGEGHASKVSYKLTRPSKIIVYFVREQEVRHDSIEGGETATQDQRMMENVVVVTDPTATVRGSQVMFGSWTKVDDLFPYWNQTLPSADGSVPAPPPISHTVIQQAFFEDALFRLYVPFGDDIPQPLWSGRINAVKSHYRQTFRLNRRWVDRSWQILGVRCALFDPTTNIRGRSQVYGDYCVKVSALPRQLRDNKGRLWKNFYGGGPSTPFGSGTKISDASVTPAIVSMVDDQAGIVHFDYVIDPYGAWKQIYPSLCKNLPTAVMNDTSPRGSNMRIGSEGDMPKLDSAFHCATVLTHIPSMPNGNGQFYKFEVSPSDVAGLVKGLVIEPANGPVWEEYIEAGVVTARMAWTDTAAQAIERSFGVGVGNDPNQNAGDSSVLESLVVNKEDLKAVAYAKAAEIWSKLTDRYIGGKAVRMDPSIAVRGSIEAVSHVVTPEGAMMTRVTLPEELQSRNYLALLPEGTRRVVFREVVPQ